MQHKRIKMRKSSGYGEVIVNVVKRFTNGDHIQNATDIQ